MKTKSEKKLFRIGIYIFIALILIAFCVLINVLRKKASIYPETTIGNTAGNLNNGGLFCESNGKIFYSNPKNNGYLYSMNLDEEENKLLIPATSRNILCGGNDVYYTQISLSSKDKTTVGENGDAAGLGYSLTVHSMNRCSRDGKRSDSLNHDLTVTAQLVGNTLYCLKTANNQITFEQHNTDGTGKEVLAEYVVNPACALDGKIYYSDAKDNHQLRCLDTSTGAISTIYTGSVWNPCIYEGYIYFMDVDRDYCLSRYELRTGEFEVVSYERIDCFNVGKGYIYYQCNSQTAPALKWMYPDGSNVTVVAGGNYTNINLAGNHVYFQEFGMEGSIFHSILGTDTYSPF